MENSNWDLPLTRPAAGVANFSLTADDVPGTPAGWSVIQRTLTAGASAGVDVVEIDNGRMKLSIIPTRGMGLWRAEMNGEMLGWRSPIAEPVHPHYVSLMEPSGVGWLDGFNELMVRCGLESNGAAVFDEQGRLIFPLHGRIANKPAHSLRLSIEPAAGTISLEGVVDEFRFHFQKLRLTTLFRTSFGSASVSWRDRVVNHGGQPATMQMLYHINIGAPLLTPGAQFIAPVRSVSPRDDYPEWPAAHNFRTYEAPRPQPAERVYFLELLADPTGATQALVKHREAARAVAIRFNARQLPCLTQWRNEVPDQDGYVTGIEPATNFPNPRPFEEQHGRVVRIDPGAEWETEVALDWLVDRGAIASAEARIAELQGATTPEVHDQPLRNWSPKAQQ